TAIDIYATVSEKDARGRLDWHARFRPIDSASVEPDPETLAIVKRLEAELSQQFDVTIATLARPLDSRSSVVRSEEAAIGNLVADAIRHATGAQIAITNGGSLRGNRTYFAGYALTRRDVLSELPFGNRTVL